MKEQHREREHYNSNRIRGEERRGEEQ